MKKALRVLIVEDSEDDALLLVRLLRKGGYDPEHQRVDTAEAMAEALGSSAWDLVISDYSMPAFDGLKAFKLMRKHGADLPFIIVSGVIGEDVAVQAMKAGVHDYLLKDNLKRLLPAVERELREAGERRKRKEAERALDASVKEIRQQDEVLRDKNAALKEILSQIESKEEDVKRQVCANVEKLLPRAIYKLFGQYIFFYTVNPA